MTEWTKITQFDYMPASHTEEHVQKVLDIIQDIRAFGLSMTKDQEYEFVHLVLESEKVQTLERIEHRLYQIYRKS